MSARSVCSGTRPSRYHSTRAISAPPSRPEQLMRMPSAPSRIADCTARFMARRKATRRSSCWAIVSATSLASTSGFLHLDDVEMHLRGGELGELAAQLLDVGALLADQHAGPRRVHRDAALLVRALDHDLGDARLALLLQDVIADVHVLVQQPAVLGAAGEPAAVPRAVDADAQPDRIDLVTHYSPPSAGASSSCAFTTTVSCANGFSIGLMRPRPRAWKRVITRFLPT